MKKVYLLSVLFCFGWGSFSQTTYVPDDNFEQALIDLGLDSEPLDDWVETAAIDTVTELSISVRDISDLTGISDFVNLRVLICNTNNISTLDLSSNTLLENLICYNNDLSTLDLSSNTLLEKLNCSDNNMTILDLSENINLVELHARLGLIETISLMENTLIEIIDIDRNNIESLDLSNNIALKSLICSNNALSALDVSNNILLEELNITMNNIETIDLSNNVGLEKLYCVDVGLTELNLSENSNLVELNCGTNALTDLDLSSNGVLENLTCTDNELTVLDLSNNFFLRIIGCGKNPIEVLDFTVNDSLRRIQYQETDVTSMNVSHLFYLEELLASDMPNLAEVNVANGNNENLTLFYAVRAPNLTCITMDEEHIDYAEEHTWIWNKDDSTAFSADCGSLSLDESFEEISFYPSVFSDFIIVESTFLSEYSVMNLAGQQVQTGNITNGENRLDLFHLKSGVYLLQLKTEQGYKTRKIVKA